MKKKANDAKIKVWITKYALTQGIFTAWVKISEHNAKCAVDNVPGRFPSNILYRKPDWWLTESKAREQAERMRAKAIEAARKRLKKLNDMRFLPQGDK